MVPLTLTNIGVLALNFLMVLLMLSEARRLRRYRLRRLREVDELWRQIERSERRPA
jgi:hypothetical protein